MNRILRYCGISVIIPTYGKLNYLKDVLVSLNNQNISHFKAEIIIVYQNRTDVDKIVNSIKFRNIKVNIVHNKKLGASRARNTGTIKAKYPIVAYLDDDIVPTNRNWLQSIWNLFQRNNIRVLCGKIILDPLFPVALNKYRFLFVDFDKGSKNKFLELGSFVPSAQFIITRSLMISLGGFRASLDRVGKNLLSGCDNELTISLGKINQRIFYNPRLVVKHRVLPYRTSWSYMIKRIFWQGVTDIYVEHHFHKIGKRQIMNNLTSWFLLIIKKAVNGVINPKEETSFEDSLIYRTGNIYGIFFSLMRERPKPRPLSIYKQI